MSWKIVAAALLALIAVAGISVFTTYKISFADGAASTVADCTTKLNKQQGDYANAQAQAVAKASAAQRAADAQQLSDLQQQLQVSKQQALEAQQKADTAKATADNLTSTLARLKNESKDVDAWSGACLPADLLGSLHPGSNGKAPTGACR